MSNFDGRLIKDHYSLIGVDLPRFSVANLFFLSLVILQRTFLSLSLHHFVHISFQSFPSSVLLLDLLPSYRWPLF